MNVNLRISTASFFDRTARLSIGFGDELRRKLRKFTTWTKTWPFEKLIKRRGLMSDGRWW